jgi:hypothetical protein
MSHESILGLRDRAGDAPRLTLDRSEGERNGDIFIADFDREQRVFNAMWESFKSPKDFRIIAEREWLERIDWKQKEGDLRGKVGKATFVWLRPRIVTAGVQLDLSGSKNVEDSLGKITKIASNTVIDGVSLPEDFRARLTEFVTSSSKPSKRFSL